jgi:predicted DNA-binding ribbon-helix-helix protein
MEALSNWRPSRGEVDVAALIDLCDFCNARGFFFGGHSAGRIFRFDVADLLQRMGVSAMSIATGNVYRDELMRSPIIKRSVVIAGRKTSVSLEDAFWKELNEIASDRDMGTSELVAAINSERQLGNLSSAIRLFVLGYYHDQISEHEKHDRTQEMLANAIVSTATPSLVT